MEFVHSNGTASAPDPLSGAQQFDYGTAFSTTVSRTAQEFVENGGLTSGSMLSNGGTEFVLSGGITSYTIVSQGGFETVSGRGSAVSTTVDDGGYEVVSQRAIARDTVMNLGGNIDVTYLSYTNGGSATVNTSALLIVSVGGHTYT